MSTWIEVSGKSQEDAKQMAADQLGVSVNDIESEVLDEGTKGLFGLGHPKVRIRARVAPDAVEDLSDDRDTVALGGEVMIEDMGVGAKVVDMLERILEAMEFNASPKIVSETDDEVMINITGDSDDIGKLIGRHGQTLDALQYILAIAVHKGGTSRARVVIDAEGYRDRHKHALETKVLEIAQKVKESGNEAVLEPQSARDRRIVHMVLADDAGITTYSEGEGDDRHIVISPAK